MVASGQLVVCRFREAGVKWWRWESLVCVGSVSQVKNGGEVTVMCVSVLSVRC